MGSEGIAALFAHVAFWVLLAVGWLTRTIASVPAAIALVLWIAGAIVFPRLPYLPAQAMFPPFVAVLDLVLAFLIFNSDAPLT